MFQGRMSSVDSLSRAGAIFKVKSELVLLNTNMPRDLYQPNCVHTLYDQGCGLDKEDHRIEGIVEAGSTSQLINWGDATEDLTFGFLYMDTPEEITLVRTIRRAETGKLHLAYPLDFDPPDGTTFDAYPGCDRTYARCGELDNQEHFKGFPFLPVAETAI